MGNGILTPKAADYAALLIESGGFKVYASPGNRTAGWFHYSQVIDGVEYFGTYSDGRENFGESSHTMPIKPSRLNGSSATIGAWWGDPDTLGLDSMPFESVEYARAVARPENYCPFNAEPTEEATRRANSIQSVPQKYYGGATLRNATPYGIGTSYVPISTDMLAQDA